MAILTPPEKITNILNRLTEEGHAAYLVGGCVRDSIIGLHVNDWDIATSAAPKEVARIFPKTTLTGEKFGTVTVLLDEEAVEVTTFRAENEYHDGRHPENVEYISNIEEDLGRRDFTINAMAVSITGELVDPYGGLKDIEHRIIRSVGGPNTRFSEDALRMFRAYRFSAQLGFAIEYDTKLAIYANTEKARQISAERVRVELEKTIMTQRPELAGEIVKIGLLSRYLLSPGKTPYGVESIAKLPMEPALRWSAFCAGLIANELITSASEFLHDIRLDGKTIKACTRALAIPEFPADSVGIKRLLAIHGVDAVRCAAAANDTLKTARGEPASALTDAGEVIAGGECYSYDKLAVTGSDLIARGHPPGRELGETLYRLLEHVFEHPETNTRETLLELAQHMIEA